MGSIERQEERWTARTFGNLGCREGWEQWAIAIGPTGEPFAWIRAPATPEGRSTVAKMVAAPDALTVLARFVAFVSGGEERDMPGLISAARSALEAAKRLQP